MKRAFFVVFIIFFCLSCKCEAKETTDEIYDELNLDKAMDLITDEAKKSEIDFSPSGTINENGLSINKIFSSAATSLTRSLSGQMHFVCKILIVLIFYSIITTFVSQNEALRFSVQFAFSAIIATILLSHTEKAMSEAVKYVDEISTFMTGMLPFFSSISAINGEITTSAVQKMIVVGATTVIQNLINSLALPLCRLGVALSVAGYISRIDFGALSDFISITATKVVTVACGIMCAILYFQNAITTVTDTIALRSVKLMAGSFIPIVGSFVSEASGTLFASIRLLKSNFGIFAICILLYTSIGPIVSFFVLKLSMRFSGIISRLIGCGSEGKIFGEISRIYNILSSVMIASVCFFIFSVSLFIKSEVG